MGRQFSAGGGMGQKIADNAGNAATADN